jgi:hypothetical protein
VEIWGFPEGKSMKKDLFTSYNPQGKENIKRFPNMKHHNPAVTAKEADMYQVPSTSVKGNVASGVYKPMSGLRR